MTKTNIQNPQSSFAGQGLRAATIAQTFLVAGSLSAQSESTDSETSPVDLDSVTLTGEDFSLSSPKFTAPLVDTPKTINVIPSSVIEQQQATSLRDVLRNSPGITFRAGEGGTNAGDNLFVRGFSAEGDILVDGVRDSTQYSRDAYNLEQVEISKGPSSSTSGRGSTGGSINMVTKKPFLDNQTSVSLGLGTDDYKRATIDTNTVVNKDSNTAVRVNAMWTDLEVPGRTGITKSSWAINPTLATDLVDNLKLNLSFQHLEQDNIPDNGLWRDAAFDSNYDWTDFYGLFDRDHEDVENDILAATLSSQITDDLTLRFNTQHSDSSLDYVVTSPRVTTDSETGETLATYRDVKQKDREFNTFSNDLNLSGEIGPDSLRHSVSLGIEFTTEGYKNYNRFFDVIGDDATAPLYDPDPTITYDYTLGRSGGYTNTDADTSAIYFFDTIHLNEKWELNAGLRYENFKAEQTTVNDEGLIEEVLSTDENMLSYSGGIVFKPAENGSIYLGFGTSFSPSAEDLTLSVEGRRGPSTNSPLVDPEETRNLEIGTKWDLVDGTLAVTGALFKTEKTNARTLSADGTVYTLDGKQSIQGFELGLSGQLSEKLGAYAGYSYLDSEVDSSSNLEEVGSDLPYAPSQSFNFWLTYQTNEKLSVAGGAQYSGDYYYTTTTLDSEIPPQADYWLLDLMVSYQATENLSLQLNVKNVADEQYIERGYGGHFTPGQSRSAILSGTYKF